jgi:hypothetical protein
MGWAIGQADRDDMLAILVWTAECRAVRDICDGWKAHAERIEREMGEAEARAKRGRWSTGPGSAARRSAAAAASALKESLEPELEEARAASSECVALYEAISGRIGKCRKLGKASHRETENCGPLWQFLQQAEERLAALLDEDRQRLHVLALRERSCTPWTKVNGRLSFKWFEICWRRKGIPYCHLMPARLEWTSFARLQVVWLG